jgi:hypothetical protein
MEQKQKIVADMVQDRIELFKDYGTPDGNDIHSAGFYEAQLTEHLLHPHEHDRQHFIRLAAFAFAAIEALEREDGNG